MDHKLVIDTAVLAGEILLKSGAETYRVEDTMKHILNTGNTETAEALVMLTGIVATMEGSRRAAGDRDAEGERPGDKYLPHYRSQ